MQPDGTTSCVSTVFVLSQSAAVASFLLAVVMHSVPFQAAD